MSKKRIVVKIGSNVLTRDDGKLDITRISALVERVKSDGVQEVIFALSPTMEGDTTNFYISRRLEGLPVRLTTLARGVSVGDELEYTDEVTLGRSITERVELRR